MNKTILFLIVLVLLARGAIYMYEKNKTKIDNLVSQPERAVSTDTAYVNNSTEIPNNSAKAEISPFTISFLLTGNNEIYYYGGENHNNLSTIDYGTLGIFIKAYKDAVKTDDLLFMIKYDTKATNKNISDAVQEMEKSGVPAERYRKGHMTMDEIGSIKKYNGEN
ncbi:MAG TPA: hypothetical protein VHL77_00585 [Ferruginibacter sp.]|jgi:hypothetical protein|nr:hypothetical protein [Ferruginibacter sp.]